MTRIKLCGLSRPCDIETANRLNPEYVGFVFAPKSRRYVTPERARELKRLLAPSVRAAGVFVDERSETIEKLLDEGVIEIAQLHGREDDAFIKQLRQRTGRQVIKAFRVETVHDILRAQQCAADFVLLDSGAGTGTAFDWGLIQNMERPYFLAGGLTCGNVADAVRTLHPFAVDVSSGIETDGYKDRAKMEAFVEAVRREDSMEDPGH